MSGNSHTAVCLTEIAVVDAEPFFRAGIIQTLIAAKLAKTIVEGRSTTDALRLARNNALDAIIIDCDLPGGLETIIGIRRLRPTLNVIAMSRRISLEDVSQVLRSGVRGYVLKNSEANELVEALTLIAGGATYLTPSLLTKTIAGQRPTSPATSNLTPREDEILALVSLGTTNKEIARKLHITERTVKYFMTNIMHKLHVRNRVEAVLAARQRTTTGQRSNN